MPQFFPGLSVRQRKTRSLVWSCICGFWFAFGPMAAGGTPQSQAGKFDVLEQEVAALKAQLEELRNIVTKIHPVETLPATLAAPRTVETSPSNTTVKGQWIRTISAQENEVITIGDRNKFSRTYYKGNSEPNTVEKTWEPQYDNRDDGVGLCLRTVTQPFAAPRFPVK